MTVPVYSAPFPTSYGWSTVEVTDFSTRGGRNMALQCTVRLKWVIRPETAWKAKTETHHS